MNITLLAADIAKRIPELARDSIANNEATIAGMIQAEKDRDTAFIVDGEPVTRQQWEDARIAYTSKPPIIFKDGQDVMDYAKEVHGIEPLCPPNTTERDITLMRLMRLTNAIAKRLLARWRA